MQGAVLPWRRVHHTSTRSGHLTTAEAAARLGVSVATLKRWAQSGLLPSERTEGGHRRFRREDVEALAAPPARADDPTRRGADLVTSTDDALGLQGWLLQARRDLGSWWGVSQPLRAVAAEIYRRRAIGALGAVQVEVTLDRLRAALLRFVETALVPAGGRSLLVASAPADPDLVPPTLLQLAALESGWRAEWGGRPEPDALDEELRRRPVDALVVCASLGAAPEAAQRLGARLETLARAHRLPIATMGLARGSGPIGGVRALDSIAEVQAWLAALPAAPGTAGGAAAEAAPAAAAGGELRWDPALAVGHAVLDAQHETLFAHVGAFVAAVRCGAPVPELPEVLAFIADYVQIHFRYEESLMQDSGFPGLEAHRLEHERLVRRLDELVAGLGSPPARGALEALASLLADWLRDHVAGSDQRIGEHLRGR